MLVGYCKYHAQKSKMCLILRETVSLGTEIPMRFGVKLHQISDASKWRMGCNGRAQHVRQGRTADDGKEQRL